MEKKSILKNRNKKSKTVKLPKTVKFEITTKIYKKKNSLESLLFIIKQYIIDVLSYGENISIKDLEEVVVYLKRCLENTYQNRIHSKEFLEKSKKKQLENFENFINKNKKIHENFKNLKDLEFEILNEIQKIDSEINDIKSNINNLKHLKYNQKNSNKNLFKKQRDETFIKENNNILRLNTELNIKSKYNLLDIFNSNELVYYVHKEKEILNTEKLFDNNLKNVKNSLNNLLDEQKFNKSYYNKLNEFKLNINNNNKKKENKYMREDSSSTNSSEKENDIKISLISNINN